MNPTPLGPAAPLEAVTLEGRHVRLEPMAREHLPALVRVGLDPALWEWSPSRIAVPADMERYVESALRERERGTSLPFVTVDSARGDVIGSTRFGNYDAANRRIEIGWTWIARSHQRTAVNSEAKYLQLRHAFEVMGLVRVEWKTDALNLRSRAAIARLGAREEGTLRCHMLCDDGRRRDSVYYSMIAEEWPGARARLERLLER